MEAVAGLFEIVAEDKREYSSEYGEGRIIRQTPEAEKKGKNATSDLVTISVVLSQGARSGEMLPLVGEEARSAKLRLEQTEGLSALHLNVIISEEEEYHDEIEAGHVIRTDPAAGTALSEGDTVTLTVSKGPEIKYSKMIPCVGVDMETVQRQMEGLNLLAEFQAVESALPEGQVLSQSVEADTEVPQGSTVVFTYSDGEKLLPLPVTFVVPISPEDVRVQIFVDDMLVHDSTEPGMEGRTIDEVYQVKAGTYRLRIYANDQPWRDEMVTVSDTGA